MADRSVEVEVRANTARYHAEMAALAASSERATAAVVAGAKAQDRASIQSEAVVRRATLQMQADFAKRGVAAERAAATEAKAAARAAAAEEAAAAKVTRAAETQAAATNAAYSKLGMGLAGVGVALALGVGVAVSKFADFDQAVSRLASSGEDARNSLGALRDAAITAGAATQYSATEAVDAETELAKAGVSAANILNGALTGALNLAAAGQLGLADAAALSATALSVFGLSGDQASHVADLFSAAAGKAQGSVADIGEAFNNGALTAHQFGLSLDQTTGVLAEFANAGLTGAEAGTALRSLLLRLVSPSKQAADELQKLGINVYDAQGNFAGLSSIAGQLQGSLQNVDAATRDAALSTIFGSYAIQAASILYNDGAEGVDKWTAAVNDTGYAAKTAATLTDNLRGDIERLGGSFDTALIQGGSGANDALRKIVQTVGGAVDVFSALPGPVQQGTVAVAGIAGAIALVGGAALIATPKIRTMLTTLETTGAAGARAATGIRAVGSALAGGWGIALLAGVTALGYFAKKSAEAKQRQDEFRATLDSATASITDQTKALAAQKILDEDLLGLARQIGISGADVSSAVLGDPQSIDKVKAAIDGVTQAYVDAYNQTGDASLIPEDLSKQYLAALDLSKGIDGVGSSLQGAIQDQLDFNEILRAGKDYGGGLTSSLDAYGSAATKAGAAAVGASGDAVSGLDDEKQTVEDVIDAYEKLRGVNESVPEADAARQQALADLATTVARLKDEEGGLGAALNDTKTGFDLTTQSGRDLQESLIGVADKDYAAADAARQYALDHGTSAAEANKTFQASIAGLNDQLSTSLQNLGFTKEAADAFADSILGVPDIRTDVEIAGDAAAKAKVDAIKKAIEETPKQYLTTLQVHNLEALDNVKFTQAQIDALTGKTVPVDVDPKPAIDNESDAQRHIDSLIGRVVPVDVNPEPARTGASEAQGYVNGVQGKTVTIYVEYAVGGASGSGPGGAAPEGREARQAAPGAGARGARGAGKAGARAASGGTSYGPQGTPSGLPDSWFGATGSMVGALRAAGGSFGSQRGRDNGGGTTNHREYNIEVSVPDRGKSIDALQRLFDERQAVGAQYDSSGFGEGGDW